MIIESATIRNFQIHEEINLKFTGGLNVIVGESGEGKSAIIRALNLLIHNTPRGAEKIFKRTNSKGEIYIELKDAFGNSIVRTNKKYVLNGEVLKAFKTEVPEPITRLLPMKPINWFRQLDSHFLILETGGNAAKVLQKSIGMREQEQITKIVKSRLHDQKSTIKVTVRSIENYEDQIKKLSPVKALKKRSAGIVKRQEAIDELIDEFNDLSRALDGIEEANAILGLTIDYEHYFGKIDELTKRISKKESLEEDLDDLEELVKEIESTSIEDLSFINPTINRVDELISRYKDLEEIKVEHKNVGRIIEDLEELIETNDVLLDEIKKLTREEALILSSMKVCPICNKKM